MQFLPTVSAIAMSLALLCGPFSCYFLHSVAVLVSRRAPITVRFGAQSPEGGL